MCFFFNLNGSVVQTEFIFENQHHFTPQFLLVPPPIDNGMDT